MLTVIGTTEEAPTKASLGPTRSRTFSGDSHGESALVSVKEHHQAARVTIGQLSKQHAVHHRKDCRGRADAERQGQNCHNGEGGLAAQEPPRVTHVPKRERPAVGLTPVRPRKVDADSHWRAVRHPPRPPATSAPQ